jgi:hypothetical protein
MWRKTTELPNLPVWDYSMAKDGRKIHISEYSRLKLTYDSDAMNAILGVFRAWESLDDPVYQYLGVPLCRGNKGDFSKLVDVATSAFIRGLTWYLSNPSRRRTGFPSWSWVGWGGPVEWTTGQSAPAFLADSINIRADLGHGEWTDWGRVYQIILEGGLTSKLSP